MSIFSHFSATSSTTASTRSRSVTLHAIASAVPIHCSGPMFSLNTPYSFSVSMLQMSASSGTEPYSSPGLKAGMTAPVR